MSLRASRRGEHEKIEAEAGCDGVNFVAVERCTLAKHTTNPLKSLGGAASNILSSLESSNRS